MDAVARRVWWSWAVIVVSTALLVGLTLGSPHRRTDDAVIVVVRAVLVSVSR